MPLGSKDVARPRTPPALAEDGLPVPLRWRPVVEVKGLLLGAVVGLGATLLLQQLGAQTLDAPGLLEGLAFGIFLGITIPSLGRLWGVLRANSILRRARRGRASLAEGTK